MSTRSIVYKHYQRALSMWPKDRLRPECQFQDVLMKRVERTFLPTPGYSPETGEALDAPSVDERRELAQVNALYSLLEGRYAEKYQPRNTLMHPASNPNHYSNLLAELDAAPDRSTWGWIKNRLSGVFRFQ